LPFGFGLLFLLLVSNVPLEKVQIIQKVFNNQKI